MTGPYEQPPSDGPAPVGRYVSDWYDDDSGALKDKYGELLGEIEKQLEPGEELLCVVPVVKVSPTLDVVVVTTRRVCAGMGEELAKAGYEVSFTVADLEQIEVTGWVMENVRLVCGDGSGKKVGSLRDTTDVGPLERAFKAAKAGVIAGPGPDPTPTPTPTADPPRPSRHGPTGTASYEVYRPGANDPDELR